MSHRINGFKHSLAALALLALAACSGCTIYESAKAPDYESESAELREHYRKQQSYLLDSGLLRTDPPSVGEEFDAASLAANFEQIALRREYELREGKFVRSAEPSVLRRWERPVRIAVVLGKSLTEQERETQYSSIEELAARLRRATGHDIAVSERRPNFYVFIIDVGEASQIRKLWPELAGRLPRTFAEDIGLTPPETLCSAYATNRIFEPEFLLSQAVVFIKAENPGLIKLSCIHEELAQALGLFNDSPDANPSVFNDDEEFALLTHHDELLLRILYDPRLQPGMDAAAAMPIVRDIALELRPGR